jgi:hypothetical protein
VLAVSGAPVRVYRGFLKSLTMAKAVAKKKVAPKPKTAAAALEDEYVVDKLLGKRGKGGAVEYKVKWQGFPSTEATWEPASALSCDEIVAAFEQQQIAKKVDKKTPATRKKKMCEDCGLKHPCYGLASDGKRRWCTGCGKVHGGVSLQKAPAASLNKPPKKTCSKCSKWERRALKVRAPTGRPSYLRRLRPRVVHAAPLHVRV